MARTSLLRTCATTVFVSPWQLDRKDATPMGLYAMNPALSIAIRSQWTGMTHELELVAELVLPA